ncbi:2-phosphosulfolactate phosphatase [Streptomyces sp. NPDC049627]|uniref:2-phosphosulfolactate phosphatase n=1 Tax=Streptomyces sp. NPDC049627 TaxID=3365595 RepID=UPI0037915722
MRPIFAGTAELTEVPAVAVVIDVMRAFTVAAWAFAGGAEKIVFVDSLAQALDLKAGHPGWLAFQDGPPVPGFDLANSPAMLGSLDVQGRTVVQKTTAGTVGALAVADAQVLLCASFVVAESTASFLRQRQPDEVTFVITGRDGRAEEDMACAQYIAAKVTAPAVDAAPFLGRARNSAAAEDLAEGVRRGYRGIHPQDVELCLEADRFPFAMTAAWEDPGMVLRPVAVPRTW